jgi:hypothetical protein
VTVSAVVRHVAHVSAPRFTVCPRRSSASCAIGALPTGQADELQASVKVAKAARNGAKITLTATASGTKAVSFHATATVRISARPHSPASQPPSPTLPAPTLSSLPGNLPALPGIGASPGNPANLFPTVSPGTSASPNSSAPNSAARRQRRINAEAASATLPLDPRLIGGQLAGLAVLAGAIAIAIARLSLRAPRPRGSKASND